MKRAAVRALAEIAQAEPSELVAQAYGEPTPAFGPDYLIPRAFDPRLITNIPPAVAQAAMDTGVAVRPIEDFRAYRDNSPASSTSRVRRWSRSSRLRGATPSELPMPPQLKREQPPLAIFGRSRPRLSDMGRSAREGILVEHLIIAEKVM
jgi:hypothetical protein